MGDVIPFDQIKQAVRSTRPVPPSALEDVDDFAPDQDVLGSWVRRMFIDADGPLHNPRHDHLRDASIGWLWTSAEQLDKLRPVAGECQLVPPLQAKWGSARTHWQIRQWFGMTPTFLITISAPLAADLDDWSFCALIEHELCHAAQDIDVFGEPRFDAQGNPRFRIAGHDVEQFDDVVERYGAAAAGAERMVRLANAGPIFGQAQVNAACGTCSRRMA